MFMKNKSLLICLTPLQMLIASKIIDENPAIYDVLCLSYNDNEKYNYYYSKISAKCDISYRYMVKSQEKFGRIFEFIKYRIFLKKILKTNYDKVFLASVDNPFFHLLLSLLRKTEIQTFDDGTANIYKKSVYYVFPKKNALQQALLRILGNNYHTQQVIDESKLHHTIYEGFQNITKPLNIIKLIDLNVKNNPNKTIKIYLGQPLEDLNLKNESEIFNLLKKNTVNYYFPHPRESKKYKGFNYINSPLIFEDYIIDLLEKNYSVELFTILSSAAINVSVLNNVVVKVIRNKILYENYSSLYEVFEEMDFNFIDVDGILL
ncbi:glycosyltransferase family 52 [Acinetobacter sp. YH01024]|uniref:glycosyltransferase family 52 n=1 Tax=Acinetobacter sp. YH01024 TaxID=2601037 RepID=UPI0015D2CC23|nr:glycosyltransferase family 52 [Acinetobacter sp. YH01024]